MSSIDKRGRSTQHPRETQDIERLYPAGFARGTMLGGRHAPSLNPPLLSRDTSLPPDGQQLTIPPKYEGMFCAPGVQGTRGTCFDRSGLMRIIREYNQSYPQRRIFVPQAATNEQLWGLIRDGLARICGDQEWCWLDQDFLKHDPIIQRYYKPPKPVTPHKWLATSDLDHVLRQYEATYSDFTFMGTVPIDFDQVIEEYKNMDLCRLSRQRSQEGGKGGRKGKKRYGFVFNLDPHDQKGSHWVSMFMNLDQSEPFIGFFDSYGQPPPPQIEQLIDRLRQQAKDCLGIRLRYKCNTVQHQHQGTECGVYSLYFIYQCLRGYSFEQITETIIVDDAVNRFRHFFFRPTIYYRNQD